MASLLGSLCTFLCNPFSCCFPSEDRDQHLRVEYQSLLRDGRDAPVRYDVSFEVSVRRVASVYDQMRADLEAIDFRLGEQVASRASRTIADMEKIDQSLGSIISLGSDDLRNRKINTITRSGAEDGFSSSPEVLQRRVDVFVATYQKAKQQGDLTGFFSCFSRGDPCLSGRSESLYKYAATFDGIDVDAIPDPEKKLYLPGSVFSELIMRDFEKEADNGTLTAEAFANYVRTHADTIGPEFARFEKSEGAMAFLELLDTAGLYRKGDKVNWSDLIDRLARSPKLFDAVFRHSMTYVI